jgi:hypothetical protein
MRVRVIPVRPGRVGHDGTVSFEAEADRVTEFAYVLVLAEGMQVGIVGGEPRLCVCVRKNSQQDIVGVRPVRIGHGCHVKPVGMQVGDVRRMLTIHVPLQAPSRANLRIYDLQDLLRKEEAETGPRILGITASDLCLSQCTHFALAIGSHVHGIRTGPYLSRLFIKTQHVADLDANGSFIPDSNRGSGGVSIVAEERRSGITRRR